MTTPPEPEANDGDHAMFEYILARSRTRESSTLTIATVASSASLILIVLYFQLQLDVDSLFYIAVLGIAFAGTGILYREVTKYSIHENDGRWIDAYIRLLHPQFLVLTYKNNEPINNPLCYCGRSSFREGTLRSLLLIPIIAWFFVIDPCYIAIGTSLALFGVYAMWLTYYDKKD